MAKGKVVLLLCIRLRDGKRVYAASAIAKNGKIEPLAAVVNGKVEHHPEVVYALRYRDQSRVVLGLDIYRGRITVNQRCL